MKLSKHMEKTRLKKISKIGRKETASMIKEDNKRIAITLTKEEIELLNTISEKTGYNKSTLIKLAINRLTQDYISLIDLGKK